jgi:hypothetical protein
MRGMLGALDSWYSSLLTVRSPYIQQAEVNLETGAVGEWRIIWNGTGGMVRLYPLPRSPVS